jgi:hypothetical protein
MNDEEKDDREVRFLNVIEDDDYRQQALQEASKLRETGDPEPRFADLVAGTRYLRKCMDNLRLTDLQSRDEVEFVALWARGTLGAARYRASKGKRR